MRSMIQKVRIVSIIFIMIFTMNSCAKTINQSEDSSNSTSISGISNSDSVSISSAKEEPTTTNAVPGYVYTFATTIDTQYNQSPGTNPYSDAFAKHISEIEKSQNVKIEYKFFVAAEVINQVTTAINAGEAPFDTLEIDMNKARTLAMGGLLYDQSTLKNLNLDAKYFSRTKTIWENVSFKGKINGTLVGYPETSIMGVFFNKDLLAKNKQPDIYELYKNKQWTWAKFAEIAKAMTYDGENGKVWGIEDNATIAGMALSSNAGGTVIRDGTGKYIASYASQQGIEAAKFIRQLKFTDKSFNYVNDWNTAQKDFVEQKTAFFPFYLHQIKIFGLDLFFDLGFVPFPIGPSQTDYINNAYNARMFVVPKTIATNNRRNVEMTGKIYNEIAKISDTLDLTYSSIYRDSGLDDSAMEVYNDMWKYMKPEFSGSVAALLPTSTINGAFFTQSSDPASILKGISTQSEKIINDFYANIK